LRYIYIYVYIYIISNSFYGVLQIENYDYRWVECCVPVPCLELKVASVGGVGISFSCPGCDLMCNQ
jgi:hypothetical protein